MAADIIWYIIMFACAALFVGIGVYARNRKEPMWFWSGSEVDASEIKDVRQYNKENGVMWKLYSLWYFAAGLAEFWNAIIALIFLVAGCSVGLALLISSYNRIYRKYRVQ